MQIEDAAQENETATNTAPTITKKKNRYIKRNINKHTPTTGRTTKEQENRRKKKLHRIGIDKEGSLEWLKEVSSTGMENK